jgi:alkanesulfonate monooxygenase SsuD/methylene tetrahydromethanopterin reductase-like flavin-dependent oxidoreductase (luciferase family)
MAGGSGEAESLIPFGYDFSASVARTEEFLVELRALLDNRHTAKFRGVNDERRNRTVTLWRRAPVDSR